MTEPKRQTESYTQRMNRQERRKEMIRKAKEWFAENRDGYAPVDNGKGGAMKGDRCKPIHADLTGGCGQHSLIRYYTPDGTEIVRVCIRRFDSRKDSGCGYADKVPVGYDRIKKKAVKEDAPKENAASAAV
jgi:hypothetical protein